MPRKRKLPPTTASSSQAVLSLAWLGSPPLLPGEDSAEYDRLLAAISNAVHPTDTLEEIWVRDLVDLTFEIFRWRRLKVNLITANRHEGLARVLQIWFDYSRANELAADWAARDAEAVAEVDRLLASANLTIDAAVAQTVSLKIDPIERIDHMIMKAEARRNATLREIERHRAAFASQAQRALQDVEDAEFTDVESKQIKPYHITLSSSGAA